MPDLLRFNLIPGASLMLLRNLNPMPSSLVGRGAD
jgi:hypothetical protein